MVDMFDLDEDDLYAIDVAIEVARKLLINPQTTPKQIVGLGYALYALKRMPLVSDGIQCEFGIFYEKGSDDIIETRYIRFGISDDSFMIQRGGSVYESIIGSDSFSEPDYLIDLGGYKERGMEIYNLVDDIEEYLNLGAEINVDNYSDLTLEFEE